GPTRRTLTGTAPNNRSTWVTCRWSRTTPGRTADPPPCGCGCQPTAPTPNNPWAGSHAAPQFGAVPYVWPMAGQTQTLLQSIAASGLESSTAADGTYKYETALYIGRLILDTWLTSWHRPQAAASRHDRPGHD